GGLARGSASDARSRAAGGHNRAGAQRAADGGALSRLSAAPRGAVAQAASGPDTSWSDSPSAVVASLLGVWSRREPAGPGTGADGVSANECGSGALAGGAGRGDHVS